MEKRKRGFASMDKEKQRAIASMGGRAAHAKGTAHEWNKETAVEAGKKGGKVTSSKPGHMRRIGAIGGKAAKRRRSHER